jgi:hypothetical protein|tara:strand:- start:31 stop:492 length:462 start_codon:yes stop_codon:yes gene_type:complete
MAIKCVIKVQYKENYGYHNWNGEGECPQHWKKKGVDTLVISGLKTREANYIMENGIPKLSSIINSCKNDMYEYDVLEYYLGDDSSHQDEYPNWPILHNEFLEEHEYEEAQEAYEVASSSIYDLKYSLKDKLWYQNCRLHRDEPQWKPLQYYIT